MLHRLTLLLLVSLSSPHLEAQATQQQAAPLESLVNLRMVADSRVFAVMAALNAAGYDYESPGREMSELRRRVREQLAPLAQSEPDLWSRLRHFYEGHQDGIEPTQLQAAYISLALLLSPPPKLELELEEHHPSADVEKVMGFQDLVRELYLKAGLGQLWEQYRPLYEGELQRYRPVFHDLIQETLSYFRLAPRLALDRQIILIPDLLSAHQIVNARNLEKLYYIVVGPVGDPAENHIQLQHEYLHFLLDPVVEKYAGTLLGHASLLKIAREQPQARSPHMDNLLLMVGESLVESILLRLHPPSAPDEEMADLFEQGLVLVPHFYRALASYEGSEGVNFITYLDSIFSSISESMVHADEAKVSALRAAQGTEREEQTREEERRQAEHQDRLRLQQTINQAVELTREARYDSARGLLLQVINEDPDNGSALFYLAQISAQQGAPEEAFAFYQRASQDPSLPALIRAWCWVRIGKYLAYRQDFQQARTFFERVLQMREEGLEEVQGAAREYLKQLPETP